MGALGLLLGCGPRHETPPATEDLPRVSVRAQKVEPRKVASQEEVVGTVRARLRATLEAKVSGRIAELPVRLGQSVRLGQLVARLDAAEIQARAEQARAAVLRAERDWNRVKALFDQQTSTRAELDDAEARLSIARGALDEAGAMLTYVEVKAPFNGVITRKLADVGDLATPGKALVELEDPSALQLEAEVPEALAPRIQGGAGLSIRVDGHEGELAGAVSEIAPTADPRTRTVQVKLDLPAGAPVRTGQFARLAVPSGETESLRVPRTAVVRRGQMEIAFVVDGGAARLRLVKTGRTSGDEVEVVAGLEQGDIVVVGGAGRLLDNQPVTVDDN